MSKLPPQYLFALVLALCAAVIFLFFSMVIRPRQDTINTMRDDLTAKQTTADQYRTAAAAVPRLKASIDKLEVDRAEFVRALPVNTQFGQIIDQLRSNVGAAGATLGDLTFAPSSIQAGLPAGVRAMDINLAASGRFSQLFQMLRSLETQNRFTTVNNLDMTLPAATSSDPPLESTMNLTVYTYDPTQAAATAAAGTPNAAPAAAPAPAAPASGGIR
ncbi:hypothetical protein Dxin01_02338 [Deinococcus xinjiangensis]|uniref:Type IV pilus assembly protein PilO n=1 Tax=Deinococcus xinjiangensis TaxID=457454 RepID=A0ABP9VBH1_9DEIO